MGGTRIVMTTLSLPEGNAFGVDDIAGATPMVNYAENRAKTLFFVWVTLSEHKWVILGERRGARGFRQFVLRGIRKVQGEWALVCLTHNVLRLYAARQAP